jgi:hypothetical protein
MKVDLEQAALRYQRFFRTLTDDSVEEYRHLAAPSVRYRDSLVDAKGIDEAVAYMHSWFQGMMDLKFEMGAFALAGDIGFQHWFMIFRIRQTPKRLWNLEGMSKFTFDDDGKVIDHVDYWDASPLLESVPLIGKAVTLTRRMFT